MELPGARRLQTGAPNGFILSPNNGNQHVRVRIQMPGQNLITKINHFADSQSTTASSSVSADQSDPEAKAHSREAAAAPFTPQVIHCGGKREAPAKGKRKWRRTNGRESPNRRTIPHPPTLRPWALAHCFHSVCRVNFLSL